MGMSVYGCQTPDGYKNTQAAWLNPDALAKRLTYSLALARGHLPLNTPPNDMFFSQGGGVKKALSNKGSQPTMPPVSEELLEKTYHYQFSTKTQQALKESPQQMRAAMLLGSSEMMNY
jgi:hypothetical protein